MVSSGHRYPIALGSGKSCGLASTLAITPAGQCPGSSTCTLSRVGGRVVTGEAVAEVLKELIGTLGRPWPCSKTGQRIGQSR